MKAGVFDFIEKPFKDQALLDLLHEALARSVRTTGHDAARSEVEARFARLSQREREVMALIAQGKLNKVIAYDLGLSVRTVELHRARIMDKMEARHFSDLVRMSMVLEGAAQSA